MTKQVRQALRLEAGERILAAADDVHGRSVVGTDLALHVPAGEGSITPEGELAYERIPWEQIERAEWDREAEVLRVTRTAPFGEPMPVRVLRFEHSDRLLGLIRERVTASVVVDRWVALRGDLGIRVVARRRPVGAAEMVWSMVFDEGLDPSDLSVRDAAETALAEVRGEVEPS